MIAFRCVQQQMGMGRRLQKSSPGGESRLGDFAEVVETAEGGTARAQRGTWADGKRFTRLVAPIGLRQADRLFGIDRFIHARRIEIRIAEAIIHRTKPRGSGVRKIGGLDWRGLAGEQQQPVAICVQGKIDQDVDLIMADHFCRRFIRHADEAAPIDRRGRAIDRSRHRGSAPGRSKRSRNSGDHDATAEAAENAPRHDRENRGKRRRF